MWPMLGDVADWYNEYVEWSESKENEDKGAGLRRDFLNSARGFLYRGDSELDDQAWLIFQGSSGIPAKKEKGWVLIHLPSLDDDDMEWVRV